MLIISEVVHPHLFPRFGAAAGHEVTPESTPFAFPVTATRNGDLSRPTRRTQRAAARRPTRGPSNTQKPRRRHQKTVWGLEITFVSSCVWINFMQMFLTRRCYAPFFFASSSSAAFRDRILRRKKENVVVPVVSILSRYIGFLLSLYAIRGL